ncbi:YbaB/EbfC family nucleoid-associated protein [Nocardia sp. NPDC024068]|uniref:YbaB/EbfC family nucleoid-associated protein n=1 Tax=Nocardia sp. NPDC024068 TaxID=3157197 RepID=UPI0033F65A8B
MAAEMDLGRAIEGFAQMAADAERKTQRFTELQQRMTALTATESGAGGRVGVTVDSSGVPVAIDLTPGVRDMDSRALSAEILSCMRRAQAKLRPGIAELVQDVVGADPAGAVIVDGFNRRFPEAETRAAEPRSFVPSQADPPPPAAAPPFSPQHSAPLSGSSAAPPEPQTRKPDRDRIVTPDEPDEEDEYYRRKSWLV